MGLFGKKKDQEQQPSYSAKVLAERQKTLERMNEREGEDPDIANRMTSYTKFDGQPHYNTDVITNEPSGPKTVQEMLSELRGGNQVDSEKAKKDSAESIDKVQGYIASLKNTEVLRQVQVDKEVMSSDERARKDAQELAEIARLHGSFTNKGFLTEVKGGGVSVSAGVSDEEISGLTSSLKNKGFITEIKGAERQAPTSTAQQIADLERVSGIVGGLTNTSIRGNAAAGNIVEEEDNENKEGN